MIEVETHAVLEALGNGKNWVKSSWGHDGGPMCLHGAIRQCQPRKGDAFLIQQVANHYGWGTRFNDNKGTEWADVAKAIADHAVVTDEELEATFGPQWQGVVKVVRQAAELTEEKAEALAAASNAASNAAASNAAASNAAAWIAASNAAARVAAAWAAAWAAASAASRIAASAASSNAAASVAASNAASNAARAVVVSDLVGQYGLEQHHLDTLMAPWLAACPPAL